MEADRGNQMHACTSMANDRRKLEVGRWTEARSYSEVATEELTTEALRDTGSSKAGRLNAWKHWRGTGTNGRGLGRRQHGSWEARRQRSLDCLEAWAAWKLGHVQVNREAAKPSDAGKPLSWL